MIKTKLQIMREKYTLSKPSTARLIVDEWGRKNGDLRGKINIMYL